MAVQLRHRSHDFPVPAVGGSLLDEYAGCVPATAPAGIIPDTTALGDFPGTELSFHYGFVPRKRARVSDAASLLEEDQRAADLPPAALQQGQAQLAVTTVGDVHGRTLGCGAASTSRRASDGATTLRLEHHGSMEIDALIRLENERMRTVLESARRRHARAVLAAAARAATWRARAAEAELQHAARRNAELEEKARQMRADRDAWVGVARSHEAVAAGLRAALDRLLLQPGPAAAPPGEGEAEDARSCCFEAPASPAAARCANNGECSSAGSRSRPAPTRCKWCGGGEACVLLLPCRHLCLCRACEAAADACPVCAAAKNASLVVLLVS